MGTQLYLYEKQIERGASRMTRTNAKYSARPKFKMYKKNNQQQEEYHLDAISAIDQTSQNDLNDGTYK